MADHRHGLSSHQGLQSEGTHLDFMLYSCHFEILNNFADSLGFIVGGAPCKVCNWYQVQNKAEK